ncbi:unnamed protein product [Linum trigynum]|uniref:Uncharacterized protein n=1 Tax=Linum trigynum TaxID=586398 RepID=A0AAV2ELZ3_9ROSI
MRTANLPWILMTILFLMALSVHGDVGSDQKYMRILPPHPPPYCLIGVLGPGDHGGEACFFGDCPFACEKKFEMLRWYSYRFVGRCSDHGSTCKCFLPCKVTSSPTPSMIHDKN